MGRNNKRKGKKQKWRNPSNNAMENAPINDDAQNVANFRNDNFPYAKNHTEHNYADENDLPQREDHLPHISWDDEFNPRDRKNFRRRAPNDGEANFRRQKVYKDRIFRPSQMPPISCNATENNPNPNFPLLNFLRPSAIAPNLSENNNTQCFPRLSLPNTPPSFPCYMPPMPFVSLYPNANAQLPQFTPSPRFFAPASTPQPLPQPTCLSQTNFESDDLRRLFPSLPPVPPPPPPPPPLPPSFHFQMRENNYLDSLRSSPNFLSTSDITFDISDDNEDDAGFPFDLAFRDSDSDIQFFYNSNLKSPRKRSKATKATKGQKSKDVKTIYSPIHFGPFAPLHIKRSICDDYYAKLYHQTPEKEERTVFDDSEFAFPENGCVDYLRLDSQVEDQMEHCLGLLEFYLLVVRHFSSVLEDNLNAYLENLDSCMQQVAEALTSLTANFEARKLKFDDEKDSLSKQILNLRVGKFVLFLGEYKRELFDASTLLESSKQ